jgi:hypothetical protein
MVLQSLLDCSHDVDQLVPIGYGVERVVHRPALGRPAVAEVPAVARAFGQWVQLGRVAEQVIEQIAELVVWLALGGLRFCAVPLDARC